MREMDYKRFKYTQESLSGGLKKKTGKRIVIMETHFDTRSLRKRYTFTNLFD